MKTKVDFVKFTKISSVIFFLSLAIILVVFDIVGNHQYLDQRADKMRENYILQQKEIIKERVENIVNLINYDLAKSNNIKDSEKQISKELLRAFSQIRTGKDGYVFILRLLDIEGGKDFATMYLNPNRKDLIGKYISDDLKDAKGKMFRKEFLKGLREDGECFVDYWYKKFDNISPSPKTSYFKLTKEKDFIVASGVYLDNIEKDIDLLHNDLRKNLIIKLIYSVLAALVIILLFLFIFNYFFNKLKDDFNKLDLFFKRAAHNDEPIDLSSITTSQLTEMAKSANNMLQNKHLIQKELEESEEKYRTVADYTYDWEYWIDHEGKCLYISPSCERITGYSQKEFLQNSKFLLSIIHSDDVSLVKNHSHKVSETGEIEQIEFRITTKSGEERWIGHLCQSVYGSDSKYIGQRGSNRDITDHKEADKALKASEERYSSIVDGLLMGVAIYVDTKIVFANKTIMSMLGLTSEEEYLGKSILDFVPSNEHEKIINHIKLLQTNSTSDDVNNVKDFSLIRKDGSLISVESMTVTLNYYGKTALMVMVKDVTQRKRGEVEILKLSNAIEQTPVSVLITDVDGNIEYVNPKFTEVTGYTFKETLNKNPRVLKTNYLDKSAYEKLWKTISSGNIWTGEFHNKRKNGELFWESAIISPVKNIAGKITHYVAIKEDITEKKAILEELISSKEKAVNADKMKSIFLAQMSHEIRTPINALVSMSSLLRYDFEEGANEDQLMSFDIIDKAGERIIRTVDLLLNLSEIQAGTYEVSPTKFDIISNILSILIAEYKKAATKKNLKLSLKSNIADSELISDFYTVNQIFAQLIDNAIKYTEKGKVTIKVDRNNSDQLVVEIKDSGIGIDAEYLPKLFEPFSQEDMGYSRKFDGNGIGMALVKTYCKLNNAKIEVESEKGVGSTFRVIF